MQCCSCRFYFFTSDYLILTYLHQRPLKESRYLFEPSKIIDPVCPIVVSVLAYGLSLHSTVEIGRSCAAWFVPHQRPKNRPDAGGWVRKWNIWSPKTKLPFCMHRKDASTSWCLASCACPAATLPDAIFRLHDWWRGRRTARAFIKPLGEWVQCKKHDY
jgi:hypothetical protein